ncbi:hypothetical protein AB0P04_41690, partial [Streptomyces anulatus]
ALPRLPGMPQDHYGFGLRRYGWGSPAYGHDGEVSGQQTSWRVVPGGDLVVVVTANGGNAAALLTDLVSGLVRDLAGLSIPDFPAPPAEPEPVDPAPYEGRYRATGTWEVTGADGGLLLSTLPDDPEEERETMRMVRLDEHVFVAEKPMGGLHPVVMFSLDRERAAYLRLGGRVVPRV